MGLLYIVATPIGNLKDISLRALEVLGSVDAVVCEDTRQTLKLLNHYEISKPLISYFRHSRLSKTDFISGELSRGKNLALVTDAGTPGIADPGNKLIEQLLSICHSRPASVIPAKAGIQGGINFSGNPPRNCGAGQACLPVGKPGMTSDCELKIIPIPGASALATALSVSGFPADRFTFLGFPPQKKGREKFFGEMAVVKETVVFYESPHRILKTMEKLKELFPEREMVVCRELTKMFETIYRGAPGKILEELNAGPNNLKGEFVIVL